MYFECQYVKVQYVSAIVWPFDFRRFITIPIANYIATSDNTNLPEWNPGPKSVSALRQMNGNAGHWSSRLLTHLWDSHFASRLLIPRSTEILQIVKPSTLRPEFSASVLEQDHLHSRSRRGGDMNTVCIGYKVTGCKNIAVITMEFQKVTIKTCFSIVKISGKTILAIAIYRV